jgi:hypothetical protein
MRDLVEQVLQLQVMLVDFDLLLVGSYSALVDFHIRHTVELFDHATQEQTFLVQVFDR